MPSVRFGLLIFLTTVRTTEDSPAKHNCNWSCEIVHDHDSMNVSVQHSALHWKTIFVKTGQMKAKFQLNKRVEQDCARLPNIANTSESIEVWIAVRKDSSDFSLLRFAQINFFNDLWTLSRRFVFGSNSLEHEVNNISCVFSLRSSQISNKSNGGVGLEAIYSPYFYLKQVANFSQEKPLIGYIFSNYASTVFAGFTNSEEISHSSVKVKFEDPRALLIIIISWVFWIYFSLYGVSFLLCNFQSTISTVEIPETPTSSVHPENQTEQDETARMQSPPPDWVGGVQQSLNNLPECEGALGPKLAPSVPSELKPTQLAEQEDDVKQEIVRNRVVEECPELTPMSGPFQENDQVSDRNKSKFVSGLHVAGLINDSRISDSNIPLGTDRLNIGRSSTAFTESTCRVQIPYPDPESGGSVKLRSSPFRSSSENTDTINQETQSQARLRDNRLRKSVSVMHLQGNFSSVSLTSFIANTLLKSKYVKFVNLLLFISAKMFPMLVLDFLLLPGVLLKSTPSVTSTYFTKSVLLSTIKRCPWMLVCFAINVVRSVCLCFRKSKTWAPSFVFRKHIVCFVRGCYVTKLLAPNCDFSACSECKEETPDCLQEIDIPGNILHNDLSFDHIVKKNWKDVFCHLLPVLLSAPEYITESVSLANNVSDINRNSIGFRGFTICIKRCSIFICKLLCYICVFFTPLLFIILIVLDLALSSPTVSFCFPRVWFTVYWFENNRLKQFLCLLVEYICICCSTAWAVYFSFCYSVSLEVAAASLLMTSVDYGKETLYTYATIILFWCYLWHYYRSYLVDKYDNLNNILHNACTKDHEEQLKQYQKDDGKVYFPEDLIVSVHKLIPFRKNAIRFSKIIISCVGIQILFFSVLKSIERPTDEVIQLAFAVSAVVPPAVNLCFDRGKSKKLKDADLEVYVKKKVQQYFKQKMG